MPEEPQDPQKRIADLETEAAYKDALIDTLQEEVMALLSKKLDLGTSLKLAEKGGEETEET